MKYKKIIIGIIIAIVISIFGIRKVYYKVMQKEKNDAITLSEKKIAESIIEDIAEKYDLEDISYDYIGYGKYFSTVYYTSSQYKQLTKQEKLLFLVEVSQKMESKKPFPSDSQAAGSYFDITIICNNHTYTNFNVDGKSELMKDRKEIYSMETDYAKSLESKKNSNSSQNSNNSKYYSVHRNYSGCYPKKPHYVCYEKGRCRCVATVNQ